MSAVAQAEKRPWIEMFKGLGVGLSHNDHPWNQRGVSEAFSETAAACLSDERWLAMKKELKLRKLNIFIEHWSPSDERERFDITRKRSTIEVVAYRDIARMRVPGDPASVARQEARDVFEQALSALTS